MKCFKFISIVLLITVISTMFNFAPHPIAIAYATSSKTTANMLTADTAASTISTTTASSIAQNGSNINWEGSVSPTKVWKLTYNSPVNVLTINKNTIKVLDSKGDEIQLKLTMAVNGKEVFIQPISPYEIGTYTLVIKDGIRSKSGKKLAAQPIIHFNVEGEVQPDSVVIEPSNAETIPGGTVKFSAHLANTLFGGTDSVPGADSTAGTDTASSSNLAAGTNSFSDTQTIAAFSAGMSSFSAIEGKRIFTWSVSAQDSSNTNNGSISTDGNYQAPMTPGIYYITAESVEYPELKKTASVVVKPPVQPQVDFMLKAEGIRKPAEATPGHQVAIYLNVYNLTPSLAAAGGTTVRLKVAGRTVDEIPIYLGEKEDHVLVYFTFTLPEGEYKDLSSFEKKLVDVTFDVDPQNKIAEINENNNTASFQLTVHGLYETPIRDISSTLTVDPSSLSAYSFKNSTKVYAASPGITLNLKALISGAEKANGDDTNIKFIVDGIVIKDHNMRIYPTNYGYSEISYEYRVPFMQTSPIDFRVLLSNGSEAHIKIPVIQWDTSISAGDIFFLNDEIVLPGGRIELHAYIKNTSDVYFNSEDKKIAYRVILDGKIFYEDSYYMKDRDIDIIIPSYKIPNDRTEPLIFTIVLDPYDQLAESDETNNIASITIPIQNYGDYGTSTPNFSISPSDLESIPKLIIPGSNIELIAAIRNNSVAKPNKPLRVQFKINGTVIKDFEVISGVLRPLQYKRVAKEWTVPSDLTENPVFEVVIDPEHEFAEDDVNDNIASTILKMAPPELEITEDCISWSPTNPKAGKIVRLSANVKNSGMAPALNQRIRFVIDGQNIGEVVIPIIQGSSAATAAYNWQIPELSNAAEITWRTLAGATGKVPIPQGITKDYTFQAMADSDNKYEEINENNNLSPEKTLTAYIPYDRMVIYVQITDILGGVPGAEVKLNTASGETAAVLSDENGWCSFTGVTAGQCTLTVTKEGYETLSESFTTEDGTIQYTKYYNMQRTSDTPIYCGNDSDNDLVSDENEVLYGLKPNDADTDKDGIIDGKDLSPLINPIEPTFLYLQKVGMVRLDQPIEACGLDGWVEVWDMDFHLSSLSNELVYSRTYEDQGTRKSTMNQETYQRAVNKLFQSEKLKSYKIKDIGPKDLNIGNKEYTHDYNAEDTEIFPADALHRTEYRFYYDYLTDYQTVSLKNFEEICFPSNDDCLNYLLLPLKLKDGCSHKYSIQFVQSGLAEKIFHNSDSDYQELGFQYSFYKTDNFDDDNNMPYCQGIALVDTDGSDLFSFSVEIPAGHIPSGTDSSYLKLTPIWIENNQGSDKIFAANIYWDITGITREVIIEEQTDGSCKTLKEHFGSVEGFNNPIMSYQDILSYENSSKSKTTENWAGMVFYNPDAPEDEKFRIVEMQLKILSYVDKTVSTTAKVFSCVEKGVTEVKKVNKIENLPESYWIRQPKYNAVLAGLSVAQGAVAIYTDGLEAWKAYKEGDTITCVYYSAKAAGAVADTTVALASISKNVVAWSAKTGRFAKLACDEVGIALAAIMGGIEVIYYTLKYGETEDAIQQNAYKEKMSAACFDTAFSFVGIAYAPFIAFQVTWTIGVELYRLVCGNDLAYSVASSPSKAIVFIIYYWTEQVPSQIAEPAYNSIRNDLIESIKEENDTGKIFGRPYISVFIDPQI